MRMVVTSSVSEPARRMGANGSRRAGASASIFTPWVDSRMSRTTQASTTTMNSATSMKVTIRDVLGFGPCLVEADEGPQCISFSHAESNACFVTDVLHSAARSYALYALRREAAVDGKEDPHRPQRWIGTGSAHDIQMPSAAPDTHNSI